MDRIFGAKLRAWREAQGLTGTQLGDLSRLGQSMVSSLETGKRPPSDANLAAIAAVPEMAITLDRLKAWRAADRAGEDLRLLAAHAADVFTLVVQEPGGFYLAVEEPRAFEPASPETLKPKKDRRD